MAKIFDFFFTLTKHIFRGEGGMLGFANHKFGRGNVAV
jgi:hypothetical protein